MFIVIEEIDYEELIEEIDHQDFVEAYDNLDISFTTYRLRAGLAEAGQSYNHEKVNKALTALEQAGYVTLKDKNTQGNHEWEKEEDIKEQNLRNIPGDLKEISDDLEEESNDFEEESEDLEELSDDLEEESNDFEKESDDNVSENYVTTLRQFLDRLLPY